MHCLPKKTTGCLESLDFGHCGGRKISVIDFFFNKHVFNPKHQENILIILLNQPLTSKSARNHFKTQNQPETQFFLGLIYCFFFLLHLQSRKIINSNSLRYMELFGKQI